MFEGPIGDSAQEEDPGNGRRFGVRNLFRLRFAEFIPHKPKGKTFGSTGMDPRQTSISISLVSRIRTLKRSSGIVLTPAPLSTILLPESKV